MAFKYLVSITFYEGYDEDKEYGDYYDYDYEDYDEEDYTENEEDYGEEVYMNFLVKLRQCSSRFRHFNEFVNF